MGVVVPIVTLTQSSLVPNKIGCASRDKNIFVDAFDRNPDLRLHSTQIPHIKILIPNKRGLLALLAIFHNNPATQNNANIIKRVTHPILSLDFYAELLF